MSGSVSSMVKQLTAQLTPLQQRKVACLLGAAVADAASRPLHWIYDLDLLNQAVSSNPEKPEFWPENHSPFYSLPTGENSCYWDEAQAVMTSLSNMKDDPESFSVDKVKRELCTQFGEGSPYDMARRQEYMLLRRFNKVQGPIQGKWLHGGMIKFMENHAAGKVICGDPHIKETDGFCCSLPVVVKWAGSEGLDEMVDKVITTQSTWPVAVQHAHVACRIVENLLLDVKDPIESVKQEVRDKYPEIWRELGEVQSHLHVHHTKAVGMLFGRPCYNPGSFLGAIHAVLSSDTFDEAVRKTILAGGCNCSRSFFIGAMMGAKLGLKGIPQDWLEKTNNAKTILKLAIDICK